MQKRGKFFFSMKTRFGPPFHNVTELENGPVKLSFQKLDFGDKLSLNISSMILAVSVGFFCLKLRVNAGPLHPFLYTGMGEVYHERRVQNLLA